MRGVHLARIVVAELVDLGFSVVVGFGVVVDFGVVACGVTIVVQAFTPSLHVCLNFVSPGCPHSPRQDPPGPQQVSIPMLLRPHLGHAVE